MVWAGWAKLPALTSAPLLGIWGGKEGWGWAESGGGVVMGRP